MQAKEIKSGPIVNYNGAPCLIESRSPCRAPRPAAPPPTTSIAARNLITKQKVDITLRGGESLDEADFRKRPVKFMYADPTHVHFLDQENYKQYSLAKEDVAEESQYMTENLEGMQALIYNDECVGVQLPVAVELKVVQCDPGIKGASATAAHQARHAGDRPDRAGARVSFPGRDDQGRYPRRDVFIRVMEEKRDWDGRKRLFLARRDFLHAADCLASCESRGDAVAGGQLCGVANTRPSARRCVRL